MSTPHNQNRRVPGIFQHLRKAISTVRFPVHGQGTVEFVLTVPFILLFIFGTIEGGRLVFTYSSIASAGREAARYGAGVGGTSSGTTLYNDCDGMRAAATRLGALAGVKASDISLAYDKGPGTTSTPYCSGSTDSVHLTLGDRIMVSVATSYSPIVPLVPIPPVTLHSQSVHTVLKQVEVMAYTPPVIPAGPTCDLTNYHIDVTNPTGPIVNVTIQNDGPELAIDNLLVVWNSSGGPVLQSVTDIPSINSTGPTYSNNVGWSFPSGVRNFSLNFSKTLKSAAIVRLSLSNACSFGK